MDEQRAYWQQFWNNAGSIEIDQKSLAHKMEKQGNLILKNIGLKGKHILDVGCGFGFIDKYLVEHADCDITGIDFQLPDIKEDNGSLRFVHGDCLNLQFRKGNFDVVMAIEMLHHLDRKDVVLALREMCRVLKRGGDMVLVESNRFHPLIAAISVFDKSERNQFFMSISKVVSMLEERFERADVYPLNYFLPTYKYRTPPLVEHLRGLVYFLENITEMKYLCMEYLIIARNYEK